MNLAQLMANLANTGPINAALAKARADTIGLIEAERRARNHLRSTVLSTPEDAVIEVGSTQRYGVYQEGFAPIGDGLPVADAANLMASELAQAALDAIASPS